MPLENFTVEVQPDFIERQSKTRPIEALAEIIWNGLDADATKVDVRLTHNEFGLSSISVEDNGSGIPYSEAANTFRRLGGSWKQRGGHSKIKSRMLHGFEGRGRFKVFSLGRVAAWKVTYQADKGLRSYVITILESDIREGQIGEDRPAAPDAHTGIEVTISELHRDFRSLEPENSVQELSRFLLFI